MKVNKRKEVCYTCNFRITSHILDWARNFWSHVEVKLVRWNGWMKAALIWTNLIIFIAYRFNVLRLLKQWIRPQIGEWISESSFCSSLYSWDESHLEVALL
jgi:hypothetical protein